ncbi:hypothetical protein Btru_040796 [Bulinus truncatus]|nr:hypothetical protein Btru_040796 [Bulinus truncatus]
MKDFVGFMKDSVGFMKDFVGIMKDFVGFKNLGHNVDRLNGHLATKDQDESDVALVSLEVGAQCRHHLSDVALGHQDLTRPPEGRAVLGSEALQHLVELRQKVIHVFLFEYSRYVDGRLHGRLVGHFSGGCCGGSRFDDDVRRSGWFGHVVKWDALKEGGLLLGLQVAERSWNEAGQQEEQGYPQHGGRWSHSQVHVGVKCCAFHGDLLVLVSLALLCIGRGCDDKRKTQGTCSTTWQYGWDRQGSRLVSVIQPGRMAGTDKVMDL